MPVLKIVITIISVLFIIGLVVYFKRQDDRF